MLKLNHDLQGEIHSFTQWSLIVMLDATQWKENLFSLDSVSSLIFYALHMESNSKTHWFTTKLF